MGVVVVITMMTSDQNASAIVDTGCIACGRGSM